MVASHGKKPIHVDTFEKLFSEKKASSTSMQGIKEMNKELKTLGSLWDRQGENSPDCYDSHEHDSLDNSQDLTIVRTKSQNKKDEKERATNCTSLLPTIPVPREDLYLNINEIFLIPSLLVMT